MAKTRKGGVKYSKTVTNALKWKIDKSIIDSTDLTSGIRKEIQRVFHAANRRLQNIDNSGVFSPAANAVNEYLSENVSDIARFNNFAKFSTAGKTFDELKRDYAAAIEFLKKPTSTASGARQFENEVKRQAGLSDEAFNHIKGVLQDGKINEYGSVLALIPSDPQKVVDLFTEASRDISDEIENAAENLFGAENLKGAIESDIDKQAAQGFPEDPTPLFDAFDNFI